MHNIPQHKSSHLLDTGIHLRRIGPETPDIAPVAYAHQDDYYIFGLVESGTGCGIVDFNELLFQAGHVFLIQPGQVHNFIRSENAEGWLLIADSSLVGSTEKCIFDKFSLFASSFGIDRQRRNELGQIAALLAGRTGHTADRLAKENARRLAETFIGIVAEAMQDVDLQQTRHSQRHIEIVLSFRSLLIEHLAANRQPSYYASLLNISAVYLNEVVKSVTGMSTSRYIKQETVLQAKRLLAHTGLSVKEVAERLGIDDYAYFSRLFAQETGISPTLFRQRNLK